MALRLQPGTLFARDYRVVQPLSEGGMGAVYIVEQLSTGALRALKTMLPHLASDAEARARFEREAKVGARIASDHVVQVIAAGVDEATGTPWLTMELLEGESLDRRVENGGPLPADEAAVLFAQLGHAMAAAHDAGVVHRDLKPENLHVGRPRRAGEVLALKVLDFGIAKLTLDAATTATAPIGTLAWMAPEQGEPGAEVTPATDVWSIGLVAFFTLTGTMYWNAAARGSTFELVRELATGELTAPSLRAAERGAPALPAGFDAWFAGAVVRDPSARVRDGDEACRALVELLEGSPRSPSGSRAAPTRPVFVAQPIPGRSGRRWLGAAAALALVAAIATAIGWRIKPRAPADAAVPSVSAESARPIPITDLPPPKCREPKVLDLYASALQNYRDANWGQADLRLLEAAKLEPGCAAVQLRLGQSTQSSAGEHYQRARERRSDLSARDRLLIDIEEPLVQQPRDYATGARRAFAAAKENPLDAELWQRACSLERVDLEMSLAACRKAVELDPLYADAWQVLAGRLGDLGRHDQQREAIDHCVEISPSSVDCRRDRSDLFWNDGKCEDSLRDLDRAIQLTPNAEDLRAAWFTRMVALERPVEASRRGAPAKGPHRGRRSRLRGDGRRVRSRLDARTVRRGRATPQDPRRARRGREVQSREDDAGRGPRGRLSVVARSRRRRGRRRRRVFEAPARMDAHRQRTAKRRPLRDRAFSGEEDRSERARSRAPGVDRLGEDAAGVIAPAVVALALRLPAGR